MTIKCDFNIKRTDFSLSFNAELSGNKITIIKGKSGCGKTSLLRLMAGLDYSPNNTFIVNNQVFQQNDIFIPAEKRPIAYVGQESCLLPFMNIEKNIAFAQKRRSCSDYALPNLDELFSVFDLHHCKLKLPDQLSSGETQRALVIQSIMNTPNLFLFDEAFSAIDEQRKSIILDYLMEYLEQRNLPAIYVSHDSEELKYIRSDISIQLTT
ncbi:ATP-binding cassette domain-containing protein [Pasteurella atlantica]|uniref:ATP-binding cassette domain-containing protein n=1 Tax=Pasteurellaceae TaxID=712 RepID=UPI002742C9AC|nr:ATP-binding cassette domain-containing protein [Pasteurella atlantica]MDP8034279.1 ATP-binding cassette domain-containing protein [Pasteurella atlantica]MDP8036250.1 ATP-binding cassette domain-containing protein [Pasteurella atlantica]MDP8038200.1 ATP-binding cassette domain-containing protein [Pasteurella atlantica]MDP8048517.1 ATP-binding cassette domain-containing protein [Pasteurella atlantica]MDP8050511.1 ATP-binding cassette domain-containing protein [Pasteurella atlantica]